MLEYISIRLTTRSSVDLDNFLNLPLKYRFFISSSYALDLNMH